MTDLQTLYRFVLHLVSCLLVVGLVFMISPVLASPCEAGKEEIVKAENIIDELGVGGTEVIDYSNCIVVGDLDFFNLPEEVETGKYLFRLNSSHKKYLKNGSVSNTTRQAFGNNEVSLSSKANITQEDDKNWTIEDGNRIYTIKDLGTHLKVYTGVILIKRPLKFRGTVFKGQIRTCSGPSREIKEKPPVKFSSKIDFIGASFEDVVRFDGALFKENSYFSDAHFHKRVLIREATFYKDAYFYSTQFDEEALFQKTTFHGKANFEFATFNDLAFFMDSKFRYNESEYGADFLFTRFKGITSFVKAYFNAPGRFMVTTFHGPTSFAESTFKDQTWFAGGCRFDDDVTFKGAKFFITDKNKLPRAPVIFNGVVFSGDADFSDVHFGHVAFCEVGFGDIGIATTFKKKADFRGATFEKLDLHRVIFESNVDFSGAKLGEKMDFTDVDIESASITLRWDQLCEKENEELPRIIEGYLWDGLIYGDNRVPKFEWEGVNLSRQPGKYLETDSQACCDAFVRFLSSLERNFKKHEQTKDAETVHFLAEETERKRKSDDNGLSYYDVERFILKYIYGYGVKWRRYVVLSVCALFVFALLYGRQNVLQHDKSRERKVRPCFGYNSLPTDLDKLHGKRKKIGIKSYCIDKEKKVQAYSATKITKRKSFSCRFWHGFWLSFYVFTKFGYGDVYVKNEYKWTRYAVVIEWGLGYVLGVLLFLNLISRSEPLSRLFSMFP